MLDPLGRSLVSGHSCVVSPASAEPQPLGVAIELAQALLTTSRMMEAGDVVADAVGVAIGIACAWTPLKDVLLRLDPR